MAKGFNIRAWLGLDTKNFNKGINQSKKHTTGLQKTFKSLGGVIAATFAVSSIISFGKAMFDIVTGFAKSASKLQAVLKVSKKDMKALTEQAKELGSTSAYTARDVLSLQTELAKLGFSKEEILNSSAAILDLAAATGTELAPAAELAGATLRIFNMDASEMGKATDILAKSTTISSLSMEKLATILPTVGKTAQLAGVSLERTAALAGTLTDRGLDASVAGTALRNIFLQLSKKGIKWNDAMKMINNSTDKNKTSMELFGKVSASAGVILSETATDTDTLTTALENSTGAAKEMSAVMLDNLAGDITIAKSAWEGFVLSLDEGSGVLSRIGRSTTNFFSSLLNELTQWNNGSSLALIGMKNVNDFEGKLDSTRKKTSERLAELKDKEAKRAYTINQTVTATRKLNVINNKLVEADKGRLKLTDEELTILQFKRDLLLGQIKIYNQLTISAEESATKELEIHKKTLNKKLEADKQYYSRKKELAITPLESKTFGGVETSQDAPLTMDMIYSGTDNTEKIDAINEENNAISTLADTYTILGGAIANLSGSDQMQWWVNYASTVVTNASKIIGSLMGMVAAKAAYSAASAAKDTASIPYGWIAIPGVIAAVLAMFAPLMNMPKFASGGIVGGTSFTGDNIVSGLNSGEMILNKGQQANLFAMANGSGGVGGNVNFEIRGDKLVGVLNNYSNKLSKTR